MPAITIGAPMKMKSIEAASGRPTTIRTIAVITSIRSGCLDISFLLRASTQETGSGASL
jgi:hypothetical protein